MLSSEEKERLTNIVNEAKQTTTQFGICWDDSSWDVTHLENQRAHKKERLTLNFIRKKVHRSELSTPFKLPYSDFAKAYIWNRVAQKSDKFHTQLQALIALRFLYESLLIRKTSDPTSLTLNDFKIAIEKAAKSHKLSGLYSIGTDLVKIAKWLNVNRLCATKINFHNPIPRQQKDGLDPVSQAAGLKKMPSNKILEVLADISNNPKNDNERIIMRIVDLLVVGGFRIGEVLTIPLDCWVEEAVFNENDVSGLTSHRKEPFKRFGLRYWPEKGGDPFVKWLPNIAVPLAKRAVTELTQLCTSARNVAAKLENEKGRVPLDNSLAPQDLITHKQFEKITGLKEHCGKSYLRITLKVKPVSFSKIGSNKYPQYLYRVSDIEKKLVERLGQLEVIRNENGQTQKLSQSLCVIFKGQFKPKTITWNILPELISYPIIRAALGDSTISYNIFKCRDLENPNGETLRINSHAFRHWLNTMAERGGLTDIELARWMGRRNLDSNQAYKHGTVEQRVEWAREMIRAGGLVGELSETYFAINEPIERQQFLEAFVNVMHFTPYGVCVHDFSIEPCQYHLNCLAGCKEYLRTKGDQEERKKITELRVFTAEQLKIAEQFEKSATYGANNWVEFNKRLLTGIEAALLVDNDPSSSDDTQVFPEHKSLFQPL